jgi:flagellar biosynthesis GTPase FlhF
MQGDSSAMFFFKAIAAIAAKIAGAGTVAQAAAGLGIATASVTGAGVAGLLPAPVQDAVAAVVQTVTPLNVPDSGDQLTTPVSNVVAVVPSTPTASTDVSSVNPTQNAAQSASPTSEVQGNNSQANDRSANDSEANNSPGNQSEANDSQRNDEQTNEKAGKTVEQAKEAANKAAEQAKEAADKAAEQTKNTLEPSDQAGDSTFHSGSASWSSSGDN